MMHANDRNYIDYNNIFFNNDNNNNNNNAVIIIIYDKNVITIMIKTIAMGVAIVIMMTIRCNDGKNTNITTELE